MKKIAMVLGMLSLAGLTHAADPLNGTVWKTIDDTTKKPKALVKFTEASDGSLSATIQSILVPGEENACVKCEGKYKNKSLNGVTIVRNLKLVKGEYVNGTILDPKNDKTYSLKGKLVDGGKKLELRGYLGVALLGRNQTWIRAN